MSDCPYAQAIKNDFYDEVIEFIPTEQFTEEICLLLLSKDFSLARKFEEEMFTEKVCKKLIKAKNMCLIPSSKQTELMCEDYFRVSESLCDCFAQSKSLALAAFKKDPANFRYILSPTPEMISYQPLNVRKLFENVSKAKQEMYRKFLNKNIPLSQIPYSLRSDKLYRLVVKREKSLKSIPEPLRRQFKVKKNPPRNKFQDIFAGMPLHDVLWFEQNEDICLAAILENPESLLEIRPDLLTQELCSLAISIGEPILIEHIPEKFRSDKVMDIFNDKKQKSVLYGVDALINTYARLTEEYANFDEESYAVFCKAINMNACFEFVCKFDGSSLRNVPEQYITEELCFIACEQFGCALKYVPEQFMSRMLALVACKNDSTSIKYFYEFKQIKSARF